MKMLKDPNHPLRQRLTPVIEIQRPESESRPAETLPQAARTTQAHRKTTVGRAGRALGGDLPKSVLVSTLGLLSAYMYIIITCLSMSHAWAYFNVTVGMEGGMTQ